MMYITEQKTISIVTEARQYVDDNRTGRESFSAALSRLLLEHKANHDKIQKVL